MNITYHTVAAIASAAVLSKAVSDIDGNKLYKIEALGAGLNILLHGVMDLLPHSYSLTMIPDGLIALAVIGLSMIVINDKFKLLSLCCIFGAILPDIIDKFIVRYFTSLDFYLFPWHNSGIINIFYSFYFKIFPNRNFRVTDVIISCLSLVIILLCKNRFLRTSRK